MGRWGVVRRVLAHRPLRRVELAFLGFSCAENGVWVAMLVYAYRQGGTSEAALIAVVQLLPAAVAAPWASRVSDRRGGAVGLWVGYVVQALAVTATAALLLLDAPAVAVYAGAVVAASAVTFTRPAQAALLPTIVDDPAELTAATGLTGWIESVSVFIGPALAGAAIGASGPGAAFALFAAALVASAALVRGIARTTVRSEPLELDGAADVGAIAALRAEPAAVALLAAFTVQFVVYGAFDVLAVVLAIEVLDLDASGGGYLTAAFGGGGIAGGAVALLLVGRRRLVPPLAAAAVIWGVAFLVIGGLPGVAVAFALMAVAGSAQMVLDVAGRTLLHRATPLELRGRVFGVLEGLSMLGMACGALLVPVLSRFGGPRVAVATVGALLVVAGAAVAPVLRRLDEQAALPQVDALRHCALFAGLSAPVLEDLAQSLEAHDVAPGEVIVREGDVGDRYYLIASGRVAVSRSGRELATLGAGDGFGEVALLRDGIRTSTVTAREPVTLYVLGRAPFLAAVTNHVGASAAAADAVARHLAAHDP